MGRRKIEIKAIKDDRNRSVYVHPSSLASQHSDPITLKLVVVVVGVRG